MIARPISEWHEDIGPVLWWSFPITEPPYVGSPLDLGRTIRVEATVSYGAHRRMQFEVGGWPGYRTHWTPLDIPEKPK